jgi:hypothetical protein
VSSADFRDQDTNPGFAEEQCNRGSFGKRSANNHHVVGCSSSIAMNSFLTLLRPCCNAITRCAFISPRPRLLRDKLSGSLRRLAPIRRQRSTRSAFRAASSFRLRSRRAFPTPRVAYQAACANTASRGLAMRRRTRGGRGLEQKSVAPAPSAARLVSPRIGGQHDDRKENHRRRNEGRGDRKPSASSSRAKSNPARVTSFGPGGNSDGPSYL